MEHVLLVNYYNNDLKKSKMYEVNLFKFHSGSTCLKFKKN